jgi:hypothetical protein
MLDRSKPAAPLGPPPPEAVPWETPDGKKLVWEISKGGAIKPKS